MPINDAMPDLNRMIQFFPVQNPDPKTLSTAQIDHYNQKGYISPLNVFSTKEIDAHRLYFDQLIEETLCQSSSTGKKRIYIDINEQFG